MPNRINKKSLIMKADEIRLGFAKEKGPNRLTVRSTEWSVCTKWKMPNLAFVLAPVICQSDFRAPDAKACQIPCSHPLNVDIESIGMYCDQVHCSPYRDKEELHFISVKQN